MKRALVASILGIAASVASSYGQAAFFFDTYGATPFNAATSPIHWSGGPLDATIPANGSVFADVIWSYGSTTGDAGLAVPVSSIAGYGGGWFQGGSVNTAANYASGNIQFTIEVWQGGATYGAAGNTARGSLTWSEGGFIAGGPPVTWSGFPGGLTISPIPEPSTFALAGLGSAAMLIFRRRK